MPVETIWTAQDIFKKACALISQTTGDSPDLESFTPDWLDMWLVEALPYENARRRYEANPARPPLQTAPVIKTLAEAVPYDDTLCRVALPYALACQFYIDDENEYRAQDFRARFIDALKAGVPAHVGMVKDVYACQN